MGQTTIPSAQTLRDVVSWSKRLPLWQQDSLRRLIDQGELSDADLQEIETLCCAENGVPVPQDPAPAPLPPTLPDSLGDPSRTVFLHGISHIQNVGGLADNQPLTFSPSVGLTVIYGDNGSGKSTYFRLLKQLCSTRGDRDTVRGNAFVGASGPSPSASLEYSCNGVAATCTWQSGATDAPDLSDVYVFDSSSARIHVDGKNPAQFLPYGLDLLPKLAACCDAIRSRLDERITAIRRTPQWVISPTAPDTTPAGAFIRALNSKTDPAKLRSLAEWNDMHQSRLGEINSALLTDGTARGRALRAASTRISLLAERLTRVARHIDDEAVEKLTKTQAASQDADKAAELARTRRFDDAALPETGGAVWKRLWAAAREYSLQAAYVSSAFPYVEDDALCVLCQQALTAGAKSRLQSFEEFVQNRSEKVAADLRSTLEESVALLTELGRGGRRDQDVMADILNYGPNLAQVVRRHVRSLVQRWIGIQRLLRGTPVNPLRSVEEVGAPALLHALAAEMAKEAEEAERTADPDARQSLEQEKRDLESRQWLNTLEAEVEAHIEQLRLIEKFGKCTRSTRTNAITTKSSELTERLVTDSLTAAFSSELAAIGLRSITVELVRIKGAKGQTLHQCQLRNAAGSAVKDIASEGEHRSIALAGFLSELALQGGASCVVIDDPVSSLDHQRRAAVAKRLQRLAESRQVIILTHDVVFLTEIMSFARQAGTALQVLSLSREGQRPGFVNDGLPWDWQGHKERFDTLEKEIRNLQKVFVTADQYEYADQIRRAYSRFRATIERVIEDVVFGDVLFRFRSYVKVGHLAAIAPVTQVHCDDLIRVWTHACDVTDAHDPSRGAQADPPEPNELEKDLDVVKRVVKEIKDLRKKKVAVPAIANGMTKA